MRTYLPLLLIAALTASPALAKGHSSSGKAKTVHVRQYNTKSGKAVSPHQRSTPSR